MGQYGSAGTWIEILCAIFAIGILYIMCLPLIEVFISIGLANVGTDPQTMIVITDFTHVWFPLTFVGAIIVYAWRKSGENRIA